MRDMQSEISFEAELDSAFGLFCLWDVETYRHIQTAEEWEAIFSSRLALENEIQRQTIVPIYFYGYGHYRFCVRPFGGLTQTEQSMRPLISQPYRLRAASTLGLCGVEYIGGTNQPFHRLLLKVKPGDYAVTVVLPAADKTNKPSPVKTVGYDVIVLLHTIDERAVYRTSASTFYPL